MTRNAKYTVNSANRGKYNVIFKTITTRLHNQLHQVLKNSTPFMTNPTGKML